MVRDLDRDAPDLSAILDGIAALDADLLLLTDLDYDAGGAALDLVHDRLDTRGSPYPYSLSLRPNTGRATGSDRDGDGRLGEPEDAEAWGRFAGQGGMALLSRVPLTLLADFTDLRWSDLPETRLSPEDPAPDTRRLSTGGHWVIEARTPRGPLILLAFHATPPVFDGPEDRNGRRNSDEIALWRHWLDGRLGPRPDAPVLILGNANLDPDRGEGLRSEIAALLSHPALTDPLAGRATVDWTALGLGEMRVSYVLPDAALRVTDTGTTPPADNAGPHRPVWVDLLLP
ncbi:endonuclease/exonuclease/phosphatase family protein [Litorisediminicola beolgyonensis]|uniref:Endonuclease/exonuclease/phosphatase family protein n=1 Tax=Litorisediminicola beolgyonensis TaxID=1173614 RepID=A0ABW3ZCP9_9RHOB